MRRADLGALVLAAGAGASAWLSLGALAVASNGVARTGALPPLWLLPMLMACAGAGAWATRLRVNEAWPLTLTLVVWLPWLPLRVPAAFFVWEGALEAVLWLTAAGGVATARVMARAPSQAGCATPGRASRWAAAIFVSCSLVAAVSLQGWLPGGDEPHYLVITQSLLHDGDLKIENNHLRGDFLAYTTQDIPPDYLRRGQDGEIYSIHAPGVSALVLPAFALAGYPGALALITLLSVWAVAVVWRVAFLVTDSASAAWSATAAMGLSASFILHSFTIFPDPARRLEYRDTSVRRRWRAALQRS